jgi:hypothetical protein
MYRLNSREENRNYGGRNEVRRRMVTILVAILEHLEEPRVGLNLICILEKVQIFPANRYFPGVEGISR